jgi:hypothetical protein
MPNGGVPMQMVLYPSDGTVVFYCHAGEVRVIQREAWDRAKAAAASLCTLTEAEGAALAWHLRYWLGEARLQPGYEMGREVVAEYDF